MLSNQKVKLRLYDATYRLRFCPDSLIHISPGVAFKFAQNVASIQKNRGDKSHRVIVASEKQQQLATLTIL